VTVASMGHSRVCLAKRYRTGTVERDSQGSLSGPGSHARPEGASALNSWPLLSCEFKRSQWRTRRSSKPLRSRGRCHSLGDGPARCLPAPNPPEAGATRASAWMHPVAQNTSERANPTHTSATDIGLWGCPADQPRRPPHPTAGPVYALFRLLHPGLCQPGDGRWLLIRRQEDRCPLYLLLARVDCPVGPLRQSSG
jgi:hypothetical protein